MRSTRYLPSTPLGEGFTVIEASAGTGKTYTIAAAVTRLVAREGVPIERILVVTFTRAATAELRDRIRRRLATTLRALRGRGDGPADEHVKMLLEAGAEARSRYEDRLDRALIRFDRAQIFTIHGFSFRLLSWLGFRSRLPSDVQPRKIDHLLLRRTAGDLAIARFATDRGLAPDVELKVDDLVALGKVLAETPDAGLVLEPPSSVSGPTIPGVRSELATRLRESVASRRRAAGMVSFGDTVIEARDALAAPGVGAHARALLQRRYSVALVDEAQDTDPVQWEVIRGVFGDTRLIAIGDPKQSIYAFRGADIESYLWGVGNAGAHLTLDTNWRSDGSLLSALDLLLEGVTFGDERIAYRRVDPAPRHSSARIAGAGAALEIRGFSDRFELSRQRYKSFYLVDEARMAVAEDVAGQVVRLLHSGSTVRREDGEDREIEPGDVAVLCRTGRQVDMVRDQLVRRGVPSVAARMGGVFDTPVAEQWRRFLMAVERPQRHDYVRMASTTVLVGLGSPGMPDPGALDDDGFATLQYRFLRWHRLLHERGVPAMFEEVDRVTGMTARILGNDPEGERTVTDLAHMAEEMHAAWRQGRIGSLVVWLEAAMEEASANAEALAEDPESRQRRLETDAAAVQVLTVHASKGLEYPVVLAPFLWDMPAPPPTKVPVPVFHDSADAARGAGGPRQRLVDVRGGGSGFEDNKAAAEEEGEAEEARLLYVAMTRARHRLVVWWIKNAQSCARSKLHQILAGAEKRASGRAAVDRVFPEPADVRPEDYPPNWTGEENGGVRAYFEGLVKASAGTIEVSILDQREPLNRYRPGGGAPSRLDRARFERSLDYSWTRASFTSLSPERPLANSPDTTEEADRIDEHQSEDLGGARDREQPEAEDRQLLLAGMPGGARFGSLIHKLIERVPFDAPDAEAKILREYEAVTRYSSWDLDADALAGGIIAMLDTPLGPDGDAPTLRALGAARKEMEFELPVRRTGVPVDLAGLAATVLDHILSNDPYRPCFARLREIEASGFRGNLAGAIDLTALIPGSEGPRYVVMDFKSNVLTPFDEAPSPFDYAREHLTRAMLDGNYPLQALLYQVALHRYLSGRLPGYEPRTHLGGSVYLFVRGMVGPDTPVVDGERCGVSRWHPPAQAIVAVSELLAGDGP